jgi:hypothetical protein
MMTSPRPERALTVRGIVPLSHRMLVHPDLVVLNLRF